MPYGHFIVERWQINPISLAAPSIISLVNGNADTVETGLVSFMQRSAKIIQLGLGGGGTWMCQQR
jgi:hypothetical protein